MNEQKISAFNNEPGQRADGYIEDVDAAAPAYDVACGTTTTATEGGDTFSNKIPKWVSHDIKRQLGPGDETLFCNYAIVGLADRRAEASTHFKLLPRKDQAWGQLKKIITSANITIGDPVRKAMTKYLSGKEVGTNRHDDSDSDTDNTEKSKDPKDFKDSKGSKDLIRGCR
ncbi:uncharacterized protein DFL_004582 [Arthrobotrys flagrans]|uniref:Uncharacterized protein n=1 Tax=Arthrobotrys flagrans TaxID=97331 RepID=A0A437A568_ARTFL|nr:hypothetical protein DFL_004582 [Arthrobotrys flagrans]